MTLPEEYICIILDLLKDEKSDSDEEHHVNNILHV